MALVRLRNENWGFESNCFVCEPTNAVGLRIAFHHDTDTDKVVAELMLDGAYSGAPSYVHGGISLAVLDEIQAWATIAVGGKFAVTTETTTSFHKPVRVGKTYRLEGSLTSASTDTMSTRGVIVDRHDDVCVESSSVFSVLTEATAVDAIGVDISRTDAAAYLKDP